MKKSRSASISPARNIAFAALLAVEAEEAYASNELRARSAQLSTRDAGLASQIVFGCLRFQNQLDFLIQQYSRRNPAELDPVVRIALRGAIFQIRYLERVPAHAAVDDSVEFVKTHCRPATGLTNAVLRKLNREPVVWPNRASALSCPEWLLRRWEYSFGEEKALAIAKAALTEPERYVRLPVPPPDGLEIEPTSIPGCFRLRQGSPDAPRLQDISSQSIVPHLDLQAGQSFLDLCAAPGNKTNQALETPLALAIACDSSVERIAAITAECGRVVIDAAEPMPFAFKFDRILVDAPCSGTGTLAPNPEIKWRVRPADFGRFHAKQVRILKNALTVLAPTGKLVYSTCLLEHEENEDVVKEVLSQEISGWKCEKQVYRIPGQDEGDGFFAAVILHE